MKILLAGDSTVTEQPRNTPHDPAHCYCGWGQMLHKFVVPNVKILNFARSGYSGTDFRKKGEYDMLLQNLAPGDYVMFQFGHNDQKRPYLPAYGGYIDNFRLFAAEIRERGGKPVFVTPVARNTWNSPACEAVNDLSTKLTYPQQFANTESGEYLDLLEEYAAAMKHVAAELDVPLIDLHAASMAWIKFLGMEAAKAFFHPGDYTHHNDYGGEKCAGFVAELVAQTQHDSLQELQELLV